MAAFSYQQQQLLLQNHPHPLLVIDSSSSSLLFPNTTLTPTPTPTPTPTLTLPHIYIDSNSNSNSSNSSWMSGFLEEEPNNNNCNPAYLFSSTSSSSSNNSGISVLLQNTPPPNINMDHKIYKKKYNNNSKHASSSLNSNIPLSKDTGEVIVPPNGKKQRKNMISSNDDDGPMTRDDIEEEEKKEKKKKKKICRGSSNNKKAKVESGKEEQVPTGYIHVRARRGQATDSHSLAERVRREKISERMKMLQALVPGCDKVTGKSLMLDAIINYVQSLQNQVEFLSMKIASVNPMFYDFGIDLDALMVKPEGVSSLEEPQQADVQQCYSPNQSTTNTSNTTPNNYSLPLLDTSTLLLLQQAQMPNILSEFQNNGQLLWDGDEQRQKFITQFGFTNNFSPFHY